MDWREVKEMRVDQLRSAGFAFWVYRAYDPLSCPESHAAFDGVVLSPDHPFWARWLPPFSQRCHCGISASHFATGVHRVGGKPDKPLPDWWQDVDPEAGEGAFG